MSLADTVSLLASQHPLGVLVGLFVGSLVEYLFPPFPGDTITLAGAVLVAAGDLPLPAAFLVVLAGNLLGSALDHRFGVFLARRLGRSGRPAERWASFLPLLNRARKAFQRHGDLALVLNRFLPGVRALIFVAAGFSAMPLRRVLALGALSAVAWNGLVLAAGLLLGSHLDLLEDWIRRLGWSGWLVLGTAVLVALGARAIRRRRSRHPR